MSKNKNVELVNNFYLNYDEYNQNKGLSGFAIKSIHKLMEKPFNQSFEYKNVLELGGYVGNHVDYVKHKLDNYVNSDILFDSNKKFLKDKYIYYEKKIDATNLKNVKDISYDRLISTCLILHIYDSLNALTEWNRVVKKGGVLTIWVQNEPSILMRFIRRFISSKNDKNFYKRLYTDHVNNYFRVEHHINTIFKGSKIKKYKYPFPFFPFNLNIATVFQIYK